MLCTKTSQAINFLSQQGKQDLRERWAAVSLAGKMVEAFHSKKDPGSIYSRPLFPFLLPILSFAIK